MTSVALKHSQLLAISTAHAFVKASLWPLFLARTMLAGHSSVAHVGTDGGCGVADLAANENNALAGQPAAPSFPSFRTSSGYATAQVLVRTK